jgi:hypothetical protein
MGATSVPGFTADVSLYQTRVHYRTGTGSGQNSGISPQILPFCAPVGGYCGFFFRCCKGPCVGGRCRCTSGNDCSTGFCNENGDCDCFDVGEDCRFGPRSCCSGQCAADGTCALPPQVHVTYQPPQPPYGHGFPGTLTVTGTNFTPGGKVHLRIDNCDAFPYGFDVSAPIGSFSTSVACYCPGTATVEAFDYATGLKGNGAAALVPCV